MRISFNIRHKFDFKISTQYLSFVKSSFWWSVLTCTAIEMGSSRFNCSNKFSQNSNEISLTIAMHNIKTQSMKDYKKNRKYNCSYAHIGTAIFMPRDLAYVNILCQRDRVSHYAIPIIFIYTHPVRVCCRFCIMYYGITAFHSMCVAGVSFDSSFHWHLPFAFGLPSDMIMEIGGFCYYAIKYVEKKSRRYQTKEILTDRSVHPNWMECIDSMLVISESNT